MALENVARFQARLEQDAALGDKVASVEDAVRLAAELGLPFTAEEYAHARAEANRDLSPEELKNVAGGRFYL
jgi:predicted ribosomally synthesized peptide with nif11-like leader